MDIPQTTKQLENMLADYLADYMIRDGEENQTGAQTTLPP